MSLNKDIKPGDMVKFNRGLYFHWGVCIAPNQMVHVAPENGSKELNSLNSFSSTGNRAVVKIEMIDKWARECDFGCDNYLDHKYTPRDVDDICGFALQQVDYRFWLYDPVSSNCEKFVIWCRYRIEKWGKQGELFRDVAVTSLAVVGLCSLSAIGAAALAYGVVDSVMGSRGQSKRKAVNAKTTDDGENENKSKFQKQH